MSAKHGACPDRRPTGNVNQRAPVAARAVRAEMKHDMISDRGLLAQFDELGGIADHRRVDAPAKDKATPLRRSAEFHGRSVQPNQRLGSQSDDVKEKT